MRKRDAAIDAAVASVLVRVAVIEARMPHDDHKTVLSDEALEELQKRLDRLKLLPDPES